MIVLQSEQKDKTIQKLKYKTNHLINQYFLTDLMKI
jgi:hypothetical protein